MPQSANVFYIYVLFRPWDGTPFYVGKGKGKRWRDNHRPKNKHFGNIVRMAQSRGMEIPKIRVRQDLSEVEAFTIEKALIGAIGRGKCGPLVNGTDGGEGTSGHAVSSDVAKRSSERMKALWKDPVWRDNTIRCLNGNTHTLGSSLRPDHRAKIGKSNIGRIGTWRGKRLSAEHREKIGAAGRGRKHSAEAKEKMRAAATGRRHTEEARAKMSAAKIKAAQSRPR